MKYFWTWQASKNGWINNADGYYISEAKERITVIDEAHTLISDISYRRKDIQAINEILKVAKHTIYTTATTRFIGLQNLVDVIIKVELTGLSRRH